MKWGLRILREPVQEHFKESIDVLRCNRRSRHFRAVVAIRVAYVNRLVEEDDIRMGIPAVRIKCGVTALINDVAWSELEEETG
jgi:hypothetical protein